ncbi:hypothetical protein DFH07DRAFT_955705 [Mycena maculata]|uniref:Uncharacterized protein n=1 Tax=Mycena maculata TaxID=230809 RepID=A0AAD7NKW5_9AGAR|nr:hypothetical protein DFH07DRAFT_955705 [Mycena maculata]
MSTTIAVLSQPHVHHTDPKERAPLGPEQRKERAEARESKQNKIDEALAKWYMDTVALAEQLAVVHKKKPKYFLEMMFQGGAKMVHQQNKQNAYNTFTAEKAAESRERGESKDAPTLHEEYDAEYRGLTDEQKDEYIEHFKDRRTKEVTLRCATPRAKIQDVANITGNMKMLMAGLSTRVGVEGFFCIVRNSPDFSMQPQWFFTSTKVKAFAVAGCSVLNLCRTSKQRANYLKAMIRDLLGEKLVAIMGDANAQMQYVWYEEDIVHRYSIVLLGWTFPQLVNLSELSTSLPALQELYDALKEGRCFFKKLTMEELATRKEDWLKDVKAGVVERKHRGTRSDKGVKRKARDDDSDGKGDGNNNDQQEDDDSDEHDTAPRPQPKRRRTTAKVPSAPVIEEPPSEMEAPVAARKGRKTAAKKATTTKSTTKRTAAAPTKTSKKTAPRDDEVTRRHARILKEKATATRVQKKAGTATEAPANDDAPQPGPSRPRPRPTYVGTKAISKPLVTSDDERDDNPDADQDDVPSPPSPHRPRRQGPITSDDEMEEDPEANEGDGVLVPGA